MKLHLGAEERMEENETLSESTGRMKVTSAFERGGKRARMKKTGAIERAF